MRISEAEAGKHACAKVIPLGEGRVRLAEGGEERCIHPSHLKIFSFFLGTSKSNISGLERKAKNRGGGYI